jgi:hypothetical protein
VPQPYRYKLQSKGHSFNGNVSIARLVMEAQKMFEADIEMESETRIELHICSTQLKQTSLSGKIASQNLG